MPRLLLPAVLLLALCAHSQEQSKSPVRAALTSVLSEDQLRGLGPQAAMKDRVGLMTPEQRQAVLPKLQAIESMNPAPEVLAELHSAYELLGRHKDARRAAFAVQKARPRDSTGFTLAARSFNLEGDYPRAAEQARAALKLDPDDMNAWTVLKLSEGRLPYEPSSQTGSRGTTASTPGTSGAPATSEPSPEAMALMHRAVEAREAGVFADVLSSAQAAMRADPGSPTVQEFYRMVVADRARNMKTVKVQERLALMETAAEAGRAKEALVHAEKLYALDPNPQTRGLVEVMRVRLPKKPAPAKAALDPAGKPSREDASATGAKPQERKPVPPALPIGAGGLLLALGATGWGLWGRDRAEAWWKDVKLSAAAGAVILGGVGIVYGGYLMLGGAGVAPALGLAGSGATASAVAVEGAALAGRAAVAAGTLKLASDGYSYSSGEQQEPKGTTPDAQQNPSGRRSLDIPESLEGASSEEVRNLIPKDWPRRAMKTGRGEIFEVPGTRRSDYVQISRGDPGNPDPLHQGPYVKIARHGKKTWVPLKGNPVLK